ncbi:SDR family oxidoreductase [Rhizobium lusitanum]|uniref:NAD(P)H dehydrogenase (Quinone) n=1 Tax=Rhizobium lusitanum TaxID=293958 RepID=A0A7X0MFG5_9HYPH|nr:SDR family oxidoreductase [Rhizobium lusitanum]MBB6487090.1 NAD(P)H dehydrogenase (quinone) [Rhizobium lusitanum]
MTILITGATGKIAQHLIPSLLDQGQPVRAMVRSPDKEATLAQQGARTVIASFEDAESLDKAFAGVETLLFVTPPHEQAAAWASAGLAAAKRAGIKRIVRISALLAGSDGPSDNNRQHGGTDDELRVCGIPSVILRPHFFMQNLLADVPTLKAQDTLYAAAGNAKLSMIDTRDIADVARCALLSSAWDGNTYDLTGPTSVSFHEIAEELSEQLGREIKYRPVSPEALAQSIRDMGLGEWFAQGFHDYLLAYSRGWGDFTTNAVQAILGKQARTFRQFAKEVLVPELSETVQAA